MMVLRKLAVALLSVGVMLPGLSHALTVGTIDTKSALGEPFQGQIPLTDLGDLSADEIKVSLGSQDDFERMGVDRVYFLSELKFDVVVGQGGQAVINVSSAKPVREPYLDFVIQVTWPSGNFSKEVTALLDPPMLGDTSAPKIDQAQVAAPAPAPVTTPVAPATTAPAPVVSAPVSSSAPAEAEPKPAAAGKTKRPVAAREPKPAPVVSSDYRIRPSDTLWGVAQKVRPSNSVTVTQTMIALQKQNPSAFNNSNINELKRGQVLHIPTEDQIREVSAQEANASVRDQTNAWRGLTAQNNGKGKLEGQQVDATSKPEAAPKAEAAEPKSEMKLLAPEGGKNAVAAAGKENKLSASTAKKVSENHAKVEHAKKENKQLAEKVGTLDNQVKSNDKKLQLQNAKLADLQTQLKAQEAKEQAAKADAASKKVAEKPAAVPAVAPAVAKTPDAVKPVEAKPAEVKAAENSAATPAPAMAEGSAATGPQAAQIEPKITSKPLPESKPKPKMEMSTPAQDDSGLPDWAPLAGGGALAAALVGGLLWWRKKKKDQADEEAALAELEAMEEHGDADHGLHSGSVDLPFAGSHDNDMQHLDLGDDLGNFMSPGNTQEIPMFKDSVLADPLEEVEQYLAYERYPQAVGFLNKSIAANPERNDLRLKLMEVYAKLDDHHGFAEQEAALEQSSDLSVLARIEELKANMSPVPVAKNKEDAIEYERHQFKPQAQAAAAHDDELPSLEELEMDFNASVSASHPNLAAFDDSAHFESAAPKVEEIDLSHSLDSDLDFSFDPAPAAPAASAHHAEDLSFKHDDLAFDTDAFASSDKGHEAHELHDLSFSLDEPALEAPKFEAPKFDEPHFDELKFDEKAAEPKDLGGMSLGEIELADFDTAPELAEPEIKASDDDLNFSLDDLEVVPPAAAAHHVADSLDGDFSLEETVRTNTSELGLDHHGFTAESGLNDMAAEFDVGLADHQHAVAPAAAPAAKAAPAALEDAGLGIDDEFDFLADTDENATKLDLAKAYIDMGDKEGAKDILQEVLSEGSSTQKEEAKGLLAQVG